MFEEFQICPYAGLRSFTEEESLYFKGREEHIDQATEQLQRNKFLMLTGASGDGKSSLVFAGIIPNARAGFLKSRYTQWCVATFRPERSPFHNLCQSVARQLDIANVGTVESELHRGFSALVDLYKNSRRYIDTESRLWTNADEPARQVMKREAANLILLVDQFEEFFTNPENYHHGVPSTDSSLVLNLLLETARIALEEDLPIYVVFTMRSDFVGQCAAFRGLPEYIGFSQFFVPRLNRSQLQQVIEEPAQLSGNRITHRLSERLIHDVTDGVDQLPILQHALNQIWHAANSGMEEMDLLHYAMVGGMSVDELESEQAAKFKVWFESLTPSTQAYYGEPNLQNVLDTHINKLYENAGGYYRSRTGKHMSDDDAKAVIRCAFTCLTKIDQSRAVRNRMTLLEITNILGRPEFDAQSVGDVLNIFREPGNTFIHPFITDETSPRSLSPDQVLDITHESLIRNWELLGLWAKEEFESHSISLDFGRQLNRWVASGKSNSYLFSIGPLTYFENWYTKARPNAWWIARYLPDEVDPDKKLERAETLLNDSRELLRRSASKHAITRAVLRYGPRRLAVAAGIIVALSFLSFTVRNYLSQQNGAVLKSIKAQSMAIANNRQVLLGDKVDLLAEQMRYGGVTVHDVVRDIKDPVQRINVLVGIATSLSFHGQANPPPQTNLCLVVADSLIDALGIPDESKLLTSLLREVNDLQATIGLAYYYHPDTLLTRLRDRNARRSASFIMQIIRHQPESFNNAAEFGLALENGLNRKAFSDLEINQLLSVLSPYEGKQSKWAQKFFARDNFLERGTVGYGFKFNGLYQFLGDLYAAAGNSDNALRCIDTLMHYNELYYQNDYKTSSDNAYNILSFFFTGGHTEAVDAFAKGYSARSGLSVADFYERTLARTLHSSTTSSILDLYWWMGNRSCTNLIFSGRSQSLFFSKKMREAIEANSKSPDELNFKLALAYKMQGILKSISQESPAADESLPGDDFDRAFSHFRKVSMPYRRHTVGLFGMGSSDEAIGTRELLFLYPDIRTVFHPGEPRSFFYYYTGGSFLEHILDHHLFDEFYAGTEGQSYVGSWLNDLNSVAWTFSSFLVPPLKDGVLAKLASAMDKYKDPEGFNLLYMYMGREEKEKGNDEAALKFYRSIVPEKVLNNLRSKEFANNINSHTFRLIAFAVSEFMKTGHPDEARHLIDQFKKNTNRSTLYSFAAMDLIRHHIQGDLVNSLLDSAQREMQRTVTVTPFQPDRVLCAYTLMLNDPARNLETAKRMVRNTRGKAFAYGLICRAYGYHNKLYEASETVPALIADTDTAFILQQLLYGMAQGQDLGTDGWKNLKLNYVPELEDWIAYVDEGF